MYREVLVCRSLAAGAMTLRSSCAAEAAVDFSFINSRAPVMASTGPGGSGTQVYIFAGSAATSGLYVWAYDAGTGTTSWVPGDQMPLPSNVGVSPVSTFDVSQLDPGELAGAFAAGFVLMGTFWAIGQGARHLLDMIRR